jgi:N,N'-diacetyllegionaminate synthase
MIELNNEQIGDTNRPYIIAEVGTNFRDDINLAKAHIDEAADAGADAVKFQTHVPEAEMVESKMREMGLGDLYDRMTVYALTMAEHEELQEYCRSRGVTFLSTPYSTAAVDHLEKLDIGAYKVGSGELTNYHLLKRIAETGKPMIVSTGMHDMETVREAQELLDQYTSEFMFLYCISEYPTDPSSFNLGLIDKMKNEFEVPVGFSDHSTGIEAAAVAMARGADLVEKHFTIDRRLPGGDQDVSIEPEELEKLVEYAHLSFETKGDKKRVTENEEAIAEWARHSIVTTTSIGEGKQLTEENLTTKRPGTGIPARRYFEVLGSQVTTDLEADTIVDDSDISK